MNERMNQETNKRMNEQINKQTNKNLNEGTNKLLYADRMPFQHNVVTPKTSILSSYIFTAMLLYYSKSNTLERNIKPFSPWSHRHATRAIAAATLGAKYGHQEY